MGLEALLEAAEFLESRDQGQVPAKQRHQSLDGQLSESGASEEGSDSSGFVARSPKEERIRTKSGSSRNSDGNFEGSSGDSAFLRAGTREVHNKLEKNRRAHLKECFDFLKKNIPSLEEKRTSNLGILRSSLRYIQNLKRKEREFEIELHQFVNQKIVLQERLSSLKTDLQKMDIDVDLNALAVSQDDEDNETNSTSTATERGTPPPSDYDENDDDEEEAERLAMETNSPTPRTGKKRKHHTRKLSEGAMPVLYTRTMTPDAVRLPPKKALTQSLNSLVRYQPALVPSQSPGAPLHGNQAPQKPLPLIPITLSLSGVGHPQGLAMLNQLTAPAGFDMRMTNKLLEMAPKQQPQPAYSTTTTSPAFTLAALGHPSAVYSQAPPTEPRPLLAVKQLPVTQLLHQTLTQRQALQKQANSTQSCVTSAPLTAAQLKLPPSSQPSQILPMTTQGSGGSLVVKDRVVTIAKPPSLSNTISMQNRSSSGTTSVATMAFWPSLQKIAHPVLLTSLNAPAMTLQTASTTGTSLPAGLASASYTSLKNDFKLEPLKQSVIPFSVNSVMGTSVNVSNLQPLNNLVAFSVASTAPKTVTTLKPEMSVMSTVPLRHIVNGQLAWPFLALPRTPMIVSTSNLSNTLPVSVSVSSSIAGHMTSHPLVSLTGFNQLTHMNQLTQIMTPMTVMSPGIQMTQTGLTQAQLNSMFASPLLKPVQLPLLQSGQVLSQHLVKPVISQHVIKPVISQHVVKPVISQHVIKPVISQHVVKPVIMVTMPSVLTTPTIATCSAALVATTTVTKS